MAMRETVGSLRAYFILVGIVGGARAVSTIAAQPLAPPELKVAAGIDAVLALAFLVTGIALRTVLKDSPGLIKGLIYSTAAIELLTAGVLLALVREPIILIAPVFWLLISWYLLTNINRLSAEEKAPPETRIADAEAIRASSHRGDR